MTRRIDAFTLKVIAIIAMFINHIALSGLYGIKESEAFYIFAIIIGKLTFPIMAYLLTEGYHYTKNVKRYVMRLAMFWILSIVPFWLAFHGKHPFSVSELVNNVMFTLLMGLILIIITDRVQSAVARGLLVTLFALLTLASDWMIVGIIMIYFFHREKEGKAKVIKPILYGMIPFLAIYGAAALASGVIGLGLDRIAIEVVGILGMLLPIPLLLSYNGERGYSPVWVKWGFYAFYPIHLLILGLIVR